MHKIYCDCMHYHVRLLLSQLILIYLKHQAKSLKNANFIYGLLPTIGVHSYRWMNSDIKPSDVNFPVPSYNNNFPFKDKKIIF